jgi:hypothetical protein
MTVYSKHQAYTEEKVSNDFFQCFLELYDTFSDVALIHEIFWKFS